MTRWQVEDVFWRTVGWCMGLGLLVGIWNWAGFAGRHKRLETHLANLSERARLLASIAQQNYSTLQNMDNWNKLSSIAYTDLDRHLDALQQAVKRLERHAGTLPPEVED